MDGENLQLCFYEPDLQLKSYILVQTAFCIDFLSHMDVEICHKMILVFNVSFPDKTKLGSSGMFRPLPQCFHELSIKCTTGFFSQLTDPARMNVFKFSSKPHGSSLTNILI